MDNLERQHDHSQADNAGEIETIIRTLPIELVDADLDLAREAARLKATHPIFYADCFAAALARLRSSRVITGDREFEALEGEVDVHWLP